MLFDSWAGVLPPAQFRRHVIAADASASWRPCGPASRRARSSAFRGWPGCCSANTPRRPGSRRSALDTGADPARGRGWCRPTVALQGNLDPLALVAGGAALRRRRHAACWRRARPPAHLQSRPRHRAADAARACRRPGARSAPLDCRQGHGDVGACAHADGHRAVQPRRARTARSRSSRS